MYEIDNYKTSVLNTTYDATLSQTLREARQRRIDSYTVFPPSSSKSALLAQLEKSAILNQYGSNITTPNNAHLI